MELKMEGKIYKAQNKINGKIYIGQTRLNVKRRILLHISQSQQYFGNALRKYGMENFNINEIDKADNCDVLSEKEAYWIKFYDCICPKGYNMTSGGDKHFEVSEETRKNISKSHIGKIPWNKGKTYEELFDKNKCEEIKRIISEKSKGNQYLKGKFPSEETRKKMSIAGKDRRVSLETREKLRKSSTGRVHSKETKDKLSEMYKGKTYEEIHGEEAAKEIKKRMSEIRMIKDGAIWNKGKKGVYSHSDETKKKISISNSGEKNGFYGKIHTNEAKEKISIKNTGKRHLVSEETKEKISKSKKGKKLTEEQRLKLKERCNTKEFKEKMNEIRKNIIIPMESRLRAAEKHRGMKHSEETKQKMSESQKGRKHSEETKQKMSEWQKGMSFEEKYGIEKAKELRENLSKSKTGKVAWNKGIPRSEETKRRISQTKKGNKQ